MENACVFCFTQNLVPVDMEESHAVGVVELDLHLCNISQHSFSFSITVKVIFQQKERLS